MLNNENKKWKCFVHNEKLNNITYIVSKGCCYFFYMLSLKIIYKVITTRLLNLYDYVKIYFFLNSVRQSSKLTSYVVFNIYIL